jgi:hypothetical protein
MGKGAVKSRLPIIAKCSGLNPNVSPKGNFAGNLLRRGFWFGVVPSGIYVLLPVDKERGIVSLALPGQIVCVSLGWKNSLRSEIRKENNGCPPTISVQSASAISFPFQTALTMAAPQYFHLFFYILTVSWSPQILTDAIQATESRPS